MINKSTLERANEVSPEASSLKVEDVKTDQVENLASHEDASQCEAVNTRRTALSKREIMEQLSRERFPWDE